MILEKELATKPADLNSVPRTHLVEGEGRREQLQKVAL